MKTTIRLEGLRECKDQLRKLKTAAQKKVLEGVMMERAEPIAEDARRLVPVDDGQLQQGIGVSKKLVAAQRKAKPKGKAIRIYVGADNSPHAHLVEFGTGPRYHDDGKYVGEMPAKPFMRPAWDGNKEAALEGIVADIWAAIKKALGKVKTTRRR